MPDYNKSARRLRNAVEPVAAGGYFAPEAHAAYEALGVGGSPVNVGVGPHFGSGLTIDTALEAFRAPDVTVSRLSAVPTQQGWRRPW